MASNTIDINLVVFNNYLSKGMWKKDVWVNDFHVVCYSGQIVINGNESSPVVLQPADTIAESFKGISIRQNIGLYIHLQFKSELRTVNICCSFFVTQTIFGAKQIYELGIRKYSKGAGPGPNQLKTHCTSLTKWLTWWLTIWLSVDALQETLTLG